MELDDCPWTQAEGSWASCRSQASRGVGSRSANAAPRPFIHSNSPHVAGPLSTPPCCGLHVAGGGLSGGQLQPSRPLTQLLCGTCAASSPGLTDLPFHFLPAVQTGSRSGAALPSLAPEGPQPAQALTSPCCCALTHLLPLWRPWTCSEQHNVTLALETRASPRAGLRTPQLAPGCPCCTGEWLDQAVSTLSHGVRRGQRHLRAWPPRCTTSPSWDCPVAQAAGLPAGPRQHLQRSPASLCTCGQLQGHQGHL